MRTGRAWMVPFALLGLWIYGAGCSGEGGASCPPTGPSSSSAGETGGNGGMGTGAAGGDTGTGGVGGQGGAGQGGAGECAVADDCTAIQSSECGVRACEGGKCVVIPLKKEGTVIASQLYGDCKLRQCDAAGNVAEVPDDTDKYDDGNACTLDYCMDGMLLHGPQAAGFQCGLNNAGKCDGNGQCVRCTLDAGGPVPCAGSMVCVASVNHKDISTLDPAINKCVPASCQDGTKNNTETDVDCGGSQCAPCAEGKTCASPLDCLEAACDQGTKTCAAPSCNDSSLNGDETTADCGGTGGCPACPDFGNNFTCKTPMDCLSGVCKDAKCTAPKCNDGVQNGDEAGVDCGGSCLSLCLP